MSLKMLKVKVEMVARLQKMGMRRQRMVEERVAQKVIKVKNRRREMVVRKAKRHN